MIRLFNKRNRDLIKSGTDDTEFNDTFIVLIQVAQDDASIRTRLIQILSMHSVSRKDLLKQLISQMEDNGAPVEFVKALAYLFDDEIARAVLSEITNF